MSTIIKMNPRLADMIAAGEVVDRPSSVLKELIENAIDAKASIITVEVKDIGMSLMSVTDNGIGMDNEDVVLAFDRHATSKVKQESDLSHIHTLGFRGEALAAISAVSKVDIVSKTKDMAEGIRLVLHAGKIVAKQMHAANTGTTLTVSDLFYNTPARFKYIKSEQKERYQIIDIFNRLALANPKIALKLSVDNKVVKETVGNGDLKQLIAAIYGTKVTENMNKFDENVQKINIKGYLMNPKVVRSSKKDISLFINGRYIRNYRLTQAIIEGYHSFLMVGKYPIAMIYIAMDPSLFDVNVHPQKLEVRLINEALLAYHIENFIKRSLTGEPQAIRETLQDINHFSESYTPQALFLADDEETFLKQSDQKLPYMVYIGTYAGTYLLFQNETGLYLMDQHAAAERVRYEHYYDALAHPVFAVKERLIPYELNLTAADMETIEHHRQALLSFGFHFEDQKLVGTPTWLREHEVDIAIESMVNMLQENDAIDLKKLRDYLAKDISCKGAIKANKPLSRAEIDHLLSALSKCENPYSCPHGRPTIIKLSESDIERMFKRIV